jgi:LPS-assembly protein
MPYALPYIDSEMTFDQPILGGELGFDWSVYSIHRSSNDPYFYDQPSPFVVPTTLNTGSDLDEGTDQTRAVGILRWQRQMTSDFGTVFTPFARVRSDVYVTNNVPDPVTGLNQDSDVVSRVLPSAGFDLRWPFIANYEMGQSIITPVLQTVIATDETDTDSIGNEDAISVNFDSTSLFLNDRFTGLDRYEGGSRANVGVQYSFLASNGGFARLSAGESFHIAGKNSFGLDTGLEGSKSDLVGAATIQPWDWLSFNYQVRMEENLSQINTQEGFVNFAFSKLSGSFGYMNLHEEAAFGRNESLEQVDGALSYQFDEAWRLFGGLRYDLNNDKFLLKYAGIGFDCDCMAASVTYSESEAATAGSELDRTLRLSVELRTIGATSFTVSR